MVLLVLVLVLVLVGVPLFRSGVPVSAAALGMWPLCTRMYTRQARVSHDCAGWFLALLDLMQAPEKAHERAET